MTNNQNSKSIDEIVDEYCFIRELAPSQAEARWLHTTLQTLTDQAREEVVLKGERNRVIEQIREEVRGEMLDILEDAKPKGDKRNWGSISFDKFHTLTLAQQLIKKSCSIKT